MYYQDLDNKTIAAIKAAKIKYKNDVDLCKIVIDNLISINIFNILDDNQDYQDYHDSFFSSHYDVCPQRRIDTAHLNIRF